MDESEKADWVTLDQRLRERLRLSQAPIAVLFGSSPPAGVRRFLGSAPSSCSYWRIAATAPEGRSAFYTVLSDHFNCPVGAFTHGIDLPADRAHELGDVLGLMQKIGYLRMEELPRIPRWPAAPGAVTYARLGETPDKPDLVVLALSARAAMLLTEATRAAGVASALEPLARPTCMALPAASAHGATTSLGCIGNRTYTELGDGELYMVVRGSDLAAVAAALDQIIAANEQLAAYHAER